MKMIIKMIQKTVKKIYDFIFFSVYSTLCRMEIIYDIDYIEAKVERIYAMIEAYTKEHESEEDTIQK